MSEDADLKIRIATPDDLDEIMAIALEACADNGFVNPNPQRLLEDIWPALNRDRGMIAAIGRPGGEIEGVVLLRIGPMWYSDDLVLEEKAVFVRPEYRNARGGRGSRLAQFSKQVADQLELPLVIGILSSHRTAGKVRMYERIFGPPSGAFWLYNAKTGATAHAAE